MLKAILNLCICVAGIFLNVEAHACSCTWRDNEHILASSSLIVKGQVVSITPPQEDRPFGPYTAHIKADYLYKGAPREEVKVSYDKSDGGNCGWSFTEGEQVTVIAGGNEKKGYETGLCTMTFLTSKPNDGEETLADALETYRKQKEALQTALNEQGPKEEILRSLGKFYLQHNAFEEAEAIFTQLLKIRPKDVSALAGRASVRYKQERNEEARRDYQNALSLSRQKRRPNSTNSPPPVQLDLSYFQTWLDPEVSFSKMDLRGANFRRAYVLRIDFSGADLRNADFSQAHLHNCNFSGANLSGAKFDEAYLVNPDFSGANLEGASINSANVYQKKTNK